MAACWMAAALMAVAGAGGASGQEAAGYEPVTIENCGMTTTYEAPPERAVALDQNLTEMMLALGLEDQIVGFSRSHYSQEHLVPPEYEEAYDELNLLTEVDLPSKELLLSVEPDFVIGAFDSAFSEQRGVSRETLEDLGIHTYLLSDQCQSETIPVTFEQIHQDVRNVARIFGVEGRAEALIGDIEAQLADVKAGVEALDLPKVKVFVYDSGLDAPFSVGGTGSSNLVIEAAGGENIFRDVQDQFVDVSWEEVLERNPDVILIMDYFASDPPDVSAQKDVLIQRLGGEQPVTAIEEDRVLALPLIGFFPSIRNADTVQAVAEFLYPDLG
ncbi:MAG: ABC transporter substrate-binding protein [Egibacteraceae bacterium]